LLTPRLAGERIVQLLLKCFFHENAIIGQFMV
jgi:hypothetical protein